MTSAPTGTEYWHNGVVAVRSAALDPSRSSEIVGDGVGPDPCADVRERLHQLLLDCPRQIGSVYQAMIERPHAGPAELLPLTECANSGAVGNLRAVVLAVTDGQIPRSPARAAQGARFVRTLVRQVQDEEVRARLRETLEGLEERGALYDRNPARAGGEQGAAVADPTVRPTVDCGRSGGELPFPGSTGLIVYTYPDYRRVPCDADRNRWLLNVGSTDDERETREIVEASESDMPEAPVILRFYGCIRPDRTVNRFHAILRAAEDDDCRGFGANWFATTLEFCDAVASLLGLGVRTTPGPGGHGP